MHELALIYFMHKFDTVKSHFPEQLLVIECSR